MFLFQSVELAPAGTKRVSQLKRRELGGPHTTEVAYLLLTQRPGFESPCLLEPIEVAVFI